jgi:hypothetical protein
MRRWRARSRVRAVSVDGSAAGFGGAVGFGSGNMNAVDAGATAGAGGRPRRRGARVLVGFAFSAAAAGARAGAGVSIRLGRMRPVGRGGSLDAAGTPAGAGSLGATGTRTGDGSAGTRGPSAFIRLDFRASSVHEDATSPDGRFCRRTSTTNERGGRFMTGMTSGGFRLGWGPANRGQTSAAGRMLGARERKMQAASTPKAPLLTGS